MWLELWNRLDARLRRRNLEREMDAEMRFHLEMQVEANIQAGMSPADARRAASIAFGGADQVKAACRDARQTWIDSLVQDARYAARTLRRRPARSLGAIGLLGLAIGIATAMFTGVDALVLRPVPFPDPDQLASVLMGGRHTGSSPSHAVFRAWRECPAFAAVEAATWDNALVEYDGGVATRRMAQVTPGVFRMLGGVRPLIGRLFDASEGRPGSEDRVLLSEDVWRGLYHADPALVGRSITIDRRPMVVVGILPSAFRFPVWNSAIWHASDFTGDPTGVVPVHVRFAPTLPRTDALRMATAAAHAADPATMREWAWTQPLDSLDQYYQRAIPLLSGAVLLLFLVLCANVSGLLLGGLTARWREFTTRSALGAPRGRLVRQAFLESIGVGVGGLVAGGAFGWALVALSRTFLTNALRLHSLHPLTMDLRALGVTSLAGLVATLVAGLLPAIAGTRVDPGRPLRLADRTSTETTGARAITRVLLVGQIALSCTLLLGATLLVRSFLNLATADRGLDTSHIQVAAVELSTPTLKDQPSRSVAVRRLEEEARALPGVRSATWSYGMPPGGGSTIPGDWTPDTPGARPVKMTVTMFPVGSEFFKVYGLPILRGRSFQPGDPRDTVLVSERFARMLWPGKDPVDRTFSTRLGQLHVVGVVGELYYPSLDRTLDCPQIYVPFGEPRTLAVLSLRCEAACPDAARVHQRLAAADPRVEILKVGALEDTYAAEVARPRATAVLAFAFSTTALVAAAAGLFSLLSATVNRRRRELGIRAALGASPADIRRLVVGEGVVVALAGIAIGVVAGLSLARVLTALQYGVTMTDPLSFVVVVVVLAATIAGASWRPARQAVQTDPALLLRDE